MELLAGLQNIGTLLVISEIIRLSLPKKYPNTEFFLVLSSCIRTEYEDLRSKSPLVRTRENTDQKNLRIWTVLTLFWWSSITKKFHKTWQLFCFESSIDTYYLMYLWLIKSHFEKVRLLLFMDIQCIMTKYDNICWSIFR